MVCIKWIALASSNPAEDRIHKKSEHPEQPSSFLCTEFEKRELRGKAKIYTL
jgi:hypothetical protein